MLPPVHPTPPSCTTPYTVYMVYMGFYRQNKPYTACTIHVHTPPHHQYIGGYYRCLRWYVAYIQYYNTPNIRYIHYLCMSVCIHIPPNAYPYIPLYHPYTTLYIPVNTGSKPPIKQGKTTYIPIYMVFRGIQGWIPGCTGYP